VECNVEEFSGTINVLHLELFGNKDLRIPF